MGWIISNLDADPLSPSLCTIVVAVRQDELDAYDRHHKELEEKLDEKTALLIKFQRISMEVSDFVCVCDSAYS